MTAAPAKMILAAADAEDLELISARLQDATARLGDMVLLSRQRRFAILFNRYRWETADGSRVRAGLHFNGVRSVQSQNVKRGAAKSVVSLLAINFKAGNDGGGVVTLVLAGGGAIRLEVECLDAELSDLTGPWPARATPGHEAPARAVPRHGSEN